MQVRPTFSSLWIVVALTAVSACSSDGKGVAASPPSPSVPASPTAVATPTVVATPTPDGPLRGCVPGCVHGITKPGDLPAGVYQTVNFFGGRLRVPLDGGWTSTEDSTGEFNLARTSAPDAKVFLWEDVYPLQSGLRVRSVPETSAGLLTWLRHSGNFRVGPVTAGKLAGLPAKVFDLELSATAHNDDPGCPVKACVNFLKYPEWSEPWGLAGTGIQRFYMADVAYGGSKHVFVAVLDASSRHQLTALFAVVEPLLQSVKVPAAPA